MEQPQPEELKDLETHLEVWMRENLQEHIEQFVQTHLSGFHAAIVDYESRQRKRFWFMSALMCFASLTNITIVIILLRQLV